jgi:hypothetical protein
MIECSSSTQNVEVEHDNTLNTFEDHEVYLQEVNVVLSSLACRLKIPS